MSANGYGDGFAMLPFRLHAREGSLSMWSDNQLSILAVLISFENRKTRLSFPNHDTIAALAGVSKTTIPTAIDELRRSGWFLVVRKSIGRVRVQHAYQMKYTSYVTCGNDDRRWVTVYDDVIKSGVWAVMPPSVRKLYIIMKSFCSPGTYADYGWLDGDNLHDFFSDRLSDYPFDFMPESFLDGFGTTERPALAQLCGVSDRTYRDAKKWLTDNGLMQYYEGEAYSGIAFPYKPGKYAPNVLAAIEAAKAASVARLAGALSSGSKRTIRAIKKSTKLAQKRTGDSRLEVSKPALRQPETSPF